MIIYQPGWFSERFEKIGTVADGAAREKLATTISEHTGFLGRNGKKRGLWCPVQNVFIGGTAETGNPTADGEPTRNMCEEYEDFLHREHKTSK